MQHVLLRDVVNCFVASHPVFWTLLIKYSSDPLINMDGLYGLSTRLCVSMHERSLYVKTHDYPHTFSLEFTVPPGKLPILSTDKSTDQFSMFSSHAWTRSFLCALCLQPLTQLSTCTPTPPPASRHTFRARTDLFVLWHTFYRKV